MDETKRKAFGASIQRVMQGEHLSREECRDAFVEILRDEQPELQQGALLAALAAKGETAGEILGAWEAIDHLDTVHVEEDLPGPLLENSGTGMDRVKTFNISSAAALICAAGGVRVARHGARALSSSCGTVDIHEAVGIDPEADVATVARAVREAGIGLFNGMSARVHPGALFRILANIRFGSILNIAASLASPARCAFAVRGVHSPNLLHVVPEVLQSMGVSGMVVYGEADGMEGGMDELSILGPSRMIRFDENVIHDEQVVTPEEVGLARAAYEDIAPLADRAQEAERFVRILRGEGPKACADAAILNAGAGFLVTGFADSLSDGVARARRILESGKPHATLEAWREIQGTKQLQPAL